MQALARELEENPDLLMAMNGKLSEELRRAVFDAPELFLSFVRQAKSKSLSFRISNSKEVPWEVRDSFFEKYSTVGKSGGLGLGAYGAKVMAESMGGVIDYTSSKGDGTTVCVTLPSLVVYT
ncbi:ATP-binding protein [uncultured Pseudodesulfovibrio sp.]|uniref:ATP-binding protein n=1 Tax=uncultured Pseudodesulfovibrio sp. TaxID=2035858 RepID=UPI0029C68823|nr:ATP-binding protein [uncultured Pseudodesulfovibrio sp.]